MPTVVSNSIEALTHSSNLTDTYSLGRVIRTSVGAPARLRCVCSITCIESTHLGGNTYDLNNLALSSQHHGDRQRMCGGSTSSVIVLEYLRSSI